MIIENIQALEIYSGGYKVYRNYPRRICKGFRDIKLAILLIVKLHDPSKS